jgi:hypothetical protein
MSGPKRAVWRISYDPTPTRLDDLEQFVLKQDTWLERNGSFIKRYLGNEALSSALEARHQINECINMEDPDTGFDTYGKAWQLFNELYQQARETKQQEEHRRYQKELEHKQITATRLLSECKTLLNDTENQELLSRWSEFGKFQQLETALNNITGTLEQIRRDTTIWRKNFHQALQEAIKLSKDNAIAVQNCMPKLQTALKTLSTLNIDILNDNKEKEDFQIKKKKLQQKAEYAFQEKDLSALVQSIKSLNRFATDFRKKIKAAEFQKATDSVRAALSTCGYSVSLRTEADGTTVIQATGFPFKSVNVQMNSNSDGMKLNVTDQHGSHCVKDVQSLQNELVRQGLQLKITDWGSGKPGATEQLLSNKLSIGGAR